MSISSTIQTHSQHVTYPNLAETYFAIKVFINFLNHLFEAKMSLWNTEFFHHVLQFLKVNELIFASVISVHINQRRLTVLADVIPVLSV